MLYDDDVLFLWPPNLNVDAPVRDLSRTLAREYIGKGAEAAGYTADEYGLYKADELEVFQSAGNEDEGICRNAVGLRHSLGILVESAVTQNPRQGLTELTSSTAAQSRRVASQRQVLADTLRFMREQGDLARYASESAPVRKAEEGRERSAPVYFGGADNDPPEPEQTVFPPPSGYRLTPDQATGLAPLFALHGIGTRVRPDGSMAVPMAQAAEPVIPLLLDARGGRSVAEAARLTRRPPVPGATDRLLCVPPQRPTARRAILEGVSSPFRVVAAPCSPSRAVSHAAAPAGVRHATDTGRTPLLPLAAPGPPRDEAPLKTKDVV